jgi:broad specificity phosphatase PhoE
VTDAVEVFLVRHGETAWSISGQHTGRADIPLTDRGREQARCAGEILAGVDFDLALTSPSSRATETAELAGVGETLRPCDDLREWHYGIYEGLTTKEIRKTLAGWTVWDAEIPEGETVEQVGARADRVIELVRASGGRTVLFGHGHQLRILTARWCSMEAIDGRHLALDPGSVSILSYERETPVIERWNQPCSPVST